MSLMVADSPVYEDAVGRVTAGPIREVVMKDETIRIAEDEFPPDLPVPGADSNQDEAEQRPTPKPSGRRKRAARIGDAGEPAAIPENPTVPPPGAIHPPPPRKGEPVGQ
jgi:hypothetical protein